MLASRLTLKILCYMNQSRVLKYDFDAMPDVPFSIYFLQEDGTILNSRIYTVIEKRIENGTIKIRLAEMNSEISYNPRLHQPVNLRLPN